MSHVVVFNASAKTVKIPTTPVKYLTEVRDEACQKFSVSKEQFTLRYNNKPISLSQQIRHVNLPQGARLELVQASRSPTVISVALGLPASEKNARLVQKFASNTSLWEILRQFESGPGANYNFTQRGIPEMNGTGTGAGRLNYEMPVITVMPGHKEYGSFVDLQRTLAQLGFDSGSASLRLSFKNSGTPLEEAMTQISQYFKSADPAPAPAGAHSGTSAQASSIPDPDTAAPEALVTVAGETIRPDEPEPTPMEVDQDPIADAPASAVDNTPQSPPAATPSSVSQSAVPSSTSLPSTRNIQVFAAPTSSTPQAARQPFNERDYDPTIDQIRGLHTSYKEQSKNTRLLSDKELEEQESARLEKLNAAADRGGIVRVRFPDGAILQFSIQKQDTASSVYDLVASSLEHPTELFNLQYRDAKGQFAKMPKNAKLVFQDLKFSRSELLTFRWDDAASSAVRATKSVLSDEYRQKAQALKVDEPAADENVGPGGSSGKAQEQPGKQKKEMSAAEKESKLKNLLNRGIFKKK